jgi:hypothetical protein
VVQEEMQTLVQVHLLTFLQVLVQQIQEAAVEVQLEVVEVVVQELLLFIGNNII